jgi:hypothetical protein
MNDEDIKVFQALSEYQGRSVGIGAPYCSRHHPGQSRSVQEHDDEIMLSSKSEELNNAPTPRLKKRRALQAAEELREFAPESGGCESHSIPSGMDLPVNESHFNVLSLCECHFRYEAIWN